MAPLAKDNYNTVVCAGRENTSSSWASEHIDANQSNNPKILSLSTSTIPSIVSHFLEGEHSLPSNQSNLLDILIIWDCEYIIHVPRPNCPSSQSKCHRCGLKFSQEHSTHMIKHVKKWSNSNL